MMYFLLLACSVLLLLTYYWWKQQARDQAVSENKSDKISIMSDKPLAGFQNELLDLAFETATSIPVDPHIKDRSRAQEAVVRTCIELDQPKKTLRFIERIDNWRRGLCYAELAFFCAQHSHIKETRRYLRSASKIADEDIEKWRRDSIRVKMAQTHTLLGQMRQADEFEVGLEVSESGKVAKVRAMLCEEDSFDKQIIALDGFIASGNFDVLRNSLQACAQLFDRFYTDEKRRSLVEKKIRTSWGTLPVFIQLELLMELAESALDHADQSKAIELVNEAQLFVDDYQWPLEQRIARMAKLIELRFRAGDSEKARTSADAALALFNTQRDKIVNIYRAEALRPLAEAYQSMGDTEAALSVYKQAVEEGMENPNSRPRAEDLAATCCSMALHAVEPNLELWSRIRGIRNSLGDPW